MRWPSPPPWRRALTTAIGCHQCTERTPDSDLSDTERADAPAQDPELDDEPDDAPDFADEHTDLSFADDDRGGPEGVPEPESPRGLSGMDG
jgi:hypothetical protein